MQIQNKRRFDRRKVMAIAAGGLVLGVGASVTLAAWTDTEWVFGGNGTGGLGIGTSTFEVEQATDEEFAEFENLEDNPGGAIVFAPGALALTPGDSIYAQVALQTADDSLAGTVLLAPAVTADGVTTDDPDGLLATTLDLRVATDDAEIACGPGAFAEGAEIIANGALDTAGGTAPQTLDADATSTQFYCFEITLPALADGDDGADLMGRTIAPAWAFNATSLEPTAP